MAISLKIKGNKRTNEGIGNDLVSIGDNRFPVTDAQYPGTNGATDFIVMRHLPDKSVYTIVCKNVTPCDSNREGTLYISVSVPAKEQVEGIFNMLIELQNAYKATCMTFDGTMYHFMARNDMPQPFEEILSRYHTVRYPYKMIATSSELSNIAYLFMSPEQISDLLNDPMRGEFSRYGEIVLIPVVDPTQHVSTLNIPAKIWRSYKITVNGRPTGQTLSDPTKTVTITMPETKTHESVSMTFSLSQARETRMTGIKVDDEAQEIYLNMQPKLKPIPKPIVIPVNPKEEPVTWTEKHKKLIYIIAVAALTVLVGVAVYMFFLAPAPAVDENAKGNETEQTDGGKAPTDSIINNTDSIDKVTVLEGNIESDGKGGLDEGEVIESEEAEAERLKQEAEAKKKEKLKNDYEADKVAINKVENLSFKQVKAIFKRRNNYKELNGFSDFNAKVELANEVVSFIETLTENIPAEDYTKKITAFETRAGQLGLNGLKAKLHKRIEKLSAINTTKTNNKNF